MTSVFRVFGAAIALTVSVAATAQATEILVVNRDAVLSRAVAYEDLRPKLITLGEEMAAELEGMGIQTESFRSSAAELIQAASGLSREEFEANAALKAQEEELRREGTEIQRRQYEFQLTQLHAEAQILNAFAEVLEEIRNERGADLIIDAAAVVDGNTDLGITQVALERLNAKRPTVTLERQRIPDQPAE